MWVEVVWVSYLGDSTGIAEARRGDSGEACGMHETRRQTKTLVVRYVVKQSVEKVLKQC